MAGRRFRRRRLVGYAFVAPVFLFLCAIIVFPLGHAFWTSLQRVRGLRSTFVGAANYVHVLTDDTFWHSLWLSFAYTSVSVALHMLLGLALALLLDELKSARTALRIAFLSPWMVAPAVGATIWLWLLEPQFGVVNYLLRAAGLIDAPQAWLGEPLKAFASVVAVDVWRGVPFVMLLMLAGLQTVPAEQHEAASLDGAGRIRAFWWCIFPIMKPVVATIVVLNSISVWNDFVSPQIILGPSSGIYTVTTGVYAAVGEFSTDYTTVFPTLLLAVTPAILFFVLMQRHIIGGLVAGATKG